jgi:hypothetical protein
VPEGAVCVTGALSPSVGRAGSKETMCESMQESLPVLAGEFFVC